MSRWAAIVDYAKPVGNPTSNWQATLIQTKPTFEKFLAKLKKQKLVAYDSETSGTKVHKAHIVGVSFSWSDADNYYIPIRHETDEKQLAPEYVLGELAPVLESKEIIKVLWNAGFDKKFLRKEGIELEGFQDGMLLHFLLDENGKHKLEVLAKRHLDAKDWKNKVDEARKQVATERKVLDAKGKLRSMHIADVHFGMVKAAIVGMRGAKDTWYTLELFTRFIDELSAEQTRLYENEVALTDCLVDQEYEGVYLDVPYLEFLKKTYNKVVTKLRVKICKLLGNNELNLNSHQQLRAAFEDLDIPAVRFSKKTKEMSLDKYALAMLSKDYPVARYLRKYRALLKIISTYISGLLKIVDEEGKVYTDYNPIGAITGRIASRDPNLNNIPAVSKDGRRIRRAFIVRSGDYIIVCFDYSQIELRLIGHFSQEPAILEVYLRNGDIHQNTADILNVERWLGKKINFTLAYGAFPKKFQSELLLDGKVVSLKECQSYHYRYWHDVFPVFRKWVEKTSASIQHHKSISNYFGRIRHLDELKNPALEDWKREHLIRGGVNFVIQGTAADFFKSKMVAVHRFLKEQKVKTRIYANVYDDIQFYMHKKELWLIPEIKKIMEDDRFRLPLKVDISYSTKSWGQKKELVIDV